MHTDASAAAVRAAGGGRERGPWLGGTQAETGEWVAAPLLAAFALLASKGITQTVPSDLSLLNRRRAAAGKYPLLGYGEIKLNLNAERVVRDCKRGVFTQTMPQHMVRAHLRLLPTGRVTIVRAHVRGNPEFGVRRSHYTVLRAEDA